MMARLWGISCAALALLVVAPVTAGDQYTLEASHTAVVFDVSHVGVSYTYGRFKDVTGTFTINPDKPNTNQFEITAKAASVDTDNAKRDEHLRSPDFFDTKQFPVLSFKSTAVKPVEGGFDVTGDLSLHGVTKPVTLKLTGGKVVEFPKGVQRTGYSTQFTVKRSEFGMDKMLENIGDEVRIAVSFEGTKPK